MARSALHLLCLPLAAALALAACDDGETPAGADAVVDVDAAVDAGADTAPPIDDMLPPDAAPAGRLAADPAEVEFGLVAVGGSGTADLVLRNDGDGPVEVSALDGLDPPFSTNRSLPLTVPPAAERTVVLTFAPEAEGPVEATISIASDAEGGPLTVILRGEAARPQGSLARDVLDFGTIEPGTPAADFIEVVNDSPALDLDVFEVVGLEAPFGIPDGQVPATARLGEAARVLVQFTPEAEGEWTTPVTVRTAAGDFEMTLTGRAIVAGELELTGVEPAWAPVDAARRVVVHGGPFAAAPDAITIGGVALADVERIDEWRVAGSLPAVGAETPTGPADVRVELGGGFGVLSGAFVFTPPVADGRALDPSVEDGPQTIGPDGNPWTITGDLPVGGELTVEPGAVLLFDDRQWLVEGVLRAGGADAPTVFSTPGCEAGGGGWQGVFFAPNEAASSLQRVQIECARTDAGTAAVTIDGQGLGLTGVAVRGGGAGCIDVSGAPLTVVGADLSDCGGAGIALSADASVFRLQNSRIRGADWPVTGFANNFGRLPIGAGHDWRGNAFDGIGLGPGFIGDVTLASQPAGVRYRIRDVLTIPRGASLTLNTGAPLVLDNPIRLEGGRLVLPGRTRIQAEAGGRIEAVEGEVRVNGAPDGPLVIEGRAPDGEPAPGTWGGLWAEPGATITGGHLELRDAGVEGPAMTLRGAFGEFPGLVVEDSADVGLLIDGTGDVPGVLLAGNPGGVEIAGGAGTISGITTDPAPAVRITDPALCDAWDTAELLDGAGLPAMVDCAAPVDP